MVFSGLYSAIVGALSFLLSFPALRLRASFHIPLSRDFSYIERLICTFTPNGTREFEPRDQVFPLFSVYSIVSRHKKVVKFMSVLTVGIVRDCFRLLIFYSEKFST